MPRQVKGKQGRRRKTALRGDRIGAARALRQMSQRELGKRTEIFPSSLSRFENNAATGHGIYDEPLVRICIALDVSADYLLGLSDVPDRTSVAMQLAQRNAIVAKIVAILKRRSVDITVDYLLGALDAADNPGQAKH